MVLEKTETLLPPSWITLKIRKFFRIVVRLYHLNKSFFGLKTLQFMKEAKRSNINILNTFKINFSTITCQEFFGTALKLLVKLSDP